MIWLAAADGPVRLGREGGRQLRLAVVAGGRVEQRARNRSRRVARPRRVEVHPERLEDLRHRCPVARPVLGAISRGGSSNQHVRASGRGCATAPRARSRCRHRCARPLDCPCTLLLRGASSRHGRGSPRFRARRPPGRGPSAEYRLGVSRGRAGAVFASIRSRPTKGRPASLERTLRSLQAQDSPDWEAIVVDDGDGEGIEPRRSLRRPADPRRPHRHHRHRPGRRAERRHRARAGELGRWLDDDRGTTPPSRPLASAAEQPELLLPAAGSCARRRLPRGLRPRRRRRDAAEEQHGAHEQPRLPARAAPPLGLLDRELGGYCDWDFMLRMCDGGHRAAQAPGPRCLLRDPRQNVSTAYDAPKRQRAASTRFARPEARARHPDSQRRAFLTTGCEGC